MAVAWQTASSTATSVVEWGVAQDALHETASGTSFQAPAPLGWIHEAQLDGLPPATTIYYRAGDATDGFADVMSFHTAPEPDAECTSFHFVVIADDRSQDDYGPSENWASIAIEAAAEQPAFFIYGGDQVRDGSEARQWQNWLDATSPILGFFAHMPSIGNHDDGPGEGDGANYNQVFQLPRAEVAQGGSGSEDYYFFTYGNAIFVALSSQTYKNDGFAAQAAWLGAVLSANPRLWKFVYLHHPIYTGDLLGINHPPDEQGQNAALVPIFDAHHVDIVFQSHNHWYERFAPSACGDGSDTPCPTGDASTGTVYITTGGAGALTYDFPTVCQLSKVEGREFCDGRHHYLLLDIEGGTLTMEAWATTAQNFDKVAENHTLIDTLTLEKPEYDASECKGAGGESESEAESESESEAEAVADASSTGSGCGCALGARP